MRQRRIMSVSSKPKDERSEKLDYHKLSQLPFDDFQVQFAIIEILNKKSGRQFEDFQFMNRCFMETEFYSFLVRDYGIELSFDCIQNMKYVQVDSHVNLYGESLTQQPIQSVYFLLHGNVSKVKICSDMSTSQITVSPEIQQFKRGEGIGLELFAQLQQQQNNNKYIMTDYTYVTKSRCDFARIDSQYLLKKIQAVNSKLSLWKEKKNTQLSIMNIIKGNNLFDNVGHFDLLDISGQSQLISLSQGEYVLKNNQRSKYFYLILEGDIQIVQANNNSSTTQSDNHAIHQGNSKAMQLAAYLLNSRNTQQGQGSTPNNQSQQTEQVLSTIGKDQFFGLYEFLSSSSSPHPSLCLYSTKVISKQAKLLQIKGKVIKKLKIIKSVSFQRIKKLIFEQKRLYEERERVSGEVKQNFLRQITDDVMLSDNMRQSFSFGTDTEKNARIMGGLNDYVHNVISGSNNAISGSNNVISGIHNVFSGNHNQNSQSSQFHQLYSQTPYGQKASNMKMRLNYTRLSIESVKSSLNSTIMRGSEDIRSSSSTSHTPNILFSTNMQEGTKKGATVLLSTIENRITTSNDVNTRKHFDIFNTPDDPICQSLSLQLNEKMAKNKKMYFIQAMRELEKSSRTNPYTHQQQQSQNSQSHTMSQNHSIDMLRRSPNVRERSILEKYIQIKKKTEFKTDIDRKEDRLLRIQQLAKKQQSQLNQQQLSQQQVYNIESRIGFNNRIDTIVSKKQLRILPDNNTISNRNFQTESIKNNKSKMDQYYDHAIQQTAFHQTQDVQHSSFTNGKQTPNAQDSTSLQSQIIIEKDQSLSHNSLNSIKQIQGDKENFYCFPSKKQKKNNKLHKIKKLQDISKDEILSVCCTPSIVTPKIVSSNGKRSSLSSQLVNSSGQNKHLDQVQIEPLKESKNNNQIEYKLNSNDSLSNINGKLLEVKKEQNSKRRLTEQYNNNLSSQNGHKLYAQNPQKLNPLLQKDIVSEQENVFDRDQNEVNRYLILNRRKSLNKRNQSAQRSISVKPQLPQTTNKRVLMII